MAHGAGRVKAGCSGLRRRDGAGRRRGRLLGRTSQPTRCRRGNGERCPRAPLPHPPPRQPQAAGREPGLFQQPARDLSRKFAAESFPYPFPMPLPRWTERAAERVVFPMGSSTGTGTGTGTGTEGEYRNEVLTQDRARRRGGPGRAAGQKTQKRPRTCGPRGVIVVPGTVRTKIEYRARSSACQARPRAAARGPRTSGEFL